MYCLVKFRITSHDEVFIEVKDGSTPQQIELAAQIELSKRYDFLISSDTAIILSIDRYNLMEKPDG